MSAPSVHQQLHHLQKASNKDCLEFLKLALECLDVAAGQVEKIKSFSDAYIKLQNHESTADQALPLLCAIFGEMSVHVKTLDALKTHTTTEAIEKVQKQKAFRFAKMIIKLCSEFSDKEFSEFSDLSLPYLDHPLNSSHCPTIFSLFQKLIRAQRVVWSDSVEVLSVILTEMEKEHSLVHVYEYKSFLGLFGTATSEQDESDRKNLEMLKLSLECLGVDVKQVEDVRSVRYALRQLNNHESTAGQSLPLLSAILIELSVFVGELNDLLKHTTKKAIERCQQRKDFRFARLVIKVCKDDFSTAEFEKLRYRCSAAVVGEEVDTSSCSTVVELFQKLVRVLNVEETIAVLSDILTKLHKNSSLEHVNEYKRSTDTEQGATGRSDSLPTQELCRDRRDTQDGPPDSLPTLEPHEGGGSVKQDGPPNSLPTLELHEESGSVKQPVSNLKEHSRGRSGDHGSSSVVVTGRESTNTQGLLQTNIMFGQQLQRQSSVISNGRGTDDGVVQKDSPGKQSNTPQVFPSPVAGADVHKHPIPSFGSTPSPQGSPKTTNPQTPITTDPSTSQNGPSHSVQSSPQHNAARDSGFGQSHSIQTPSNPHDDDSNSLNSYSGFQDGITETHVLLPGKIENEVEYKTPFPPAIRSPSVLFEKYKKPCCCCCSSVVLLLFSLALFGVGAYFYNRESALVEQNSLNATSYSIRDETIILGEVNADVVSTATVEEKTQIGDSAHVSMVYLPQKDKLKKHVKIINETYGGFYSSDPWRTTGLIDATYILDAGVINYTFCSTNPDARTGVATAYVFDDYQSYFEYSGQTPGSKASSYVFKETIEVGTFNHTLCFSFEYQITKPAFYFVVVDTPSNLHYSYSYQIRQVYLLRTDYSLVCSDVYERKPCVIDLSSETGLHYVLAYVNPNSYESSVSTHLHVFTSGWSHNVNLCRTLSIASIGFGGAFFLIFLAILSVSCGVCLCKVVIQKC